MSKTLQLDAFEFWAKAAQDRSRNRVSTETVNDYRTIWHAYLRSIAPKPWHQASVEDAQEFLKEGIRANAHSRRQQESTATGVVSKRGGSEKVSQVTLKRYWRILHEVYQHAFIQDHIPENPFESLEQSRMSEAADALVLPPHLLEGFALALINDATTRAFNAGSTPNAWQTVRDDALVALLLLSGAKTSELQGLQVHDLLQPTALNAGDRPTGVRLRGDRKEQNRDIYFAPRSVPHLFGPNTTAHLVNLLNNWMALRLQVEHCPPWVFFGRKFETSTALMHANTPAAGNQGGLELIQPTEPNQRQRCHLSEKSLFVIASGAMQRLLDHQSLPNGLLHQGPQVLRNSVISMWLRRGLDQDSALACAGMADPRALSRLGPDRVLALQKAVG